MQLVIGFRGAALDIVERLKLHSCHAVADDHSIYRDAKTEIELLRWQLTNASEANKFLAERNAELAARACVAAGECGCDNGNRA